MRDGAPAAALAKAIVAELKLDIAPDRVRLLLEAGGGGAPVPLDSSEKLAGQGVEEGAKVLVELEVPPAPAKHSAFIIGARASHRSSHRLPHPLFPHPLTCAHTITPPRVSPRPISARAQPLRCN